MKIAIEHIIKLTLYVALAYFSYLMCWITVQYIPIRLDAGFLNIKQDIIQHPYYQLAFFSHVYSSIIVLLAGFTQFSTRLRQRFPKLHRLVGRVYILLVICFACPSGFVMAIHANGGWIAQTSFTILSVLWFRFTYIAYRSAIKGDWEKHRNFMLRSYSLTLSAISLRLFKWIIISNLALPPMDTYRIVALASWTINLAIVEIYILWNR